MTVKDMKEAYLSNSGKVSDFTRNVNYSAIALVWVLCDQKLTEIGNFKFTLTLFFASLIIDYFQYIWKTLIICTQYKIEDNKPNQNENSEVRYWGFIQVVTWILFGFKVIATCWGTVLLLKILWLTTE